MKKAESQKKKFSLKPALFTAAVLIIVAVCVFAPQLLIQLQDRQTEGRFTPVEGMDNTVERGSADAVHLDRVYTLINTIWDDGGNPFVESHEEKDRLCMLILEQLTNMHNGNLIPLPLVELCEEKLYAANDAITIFHSASSAGGSPEYELVQVSSENEYGITMYYDSVNRTALMLAVNFPSAYLDSGIDLETAMTNYIVWLGLGGLADWTLSGAATSSVIAHSVNAPFRLSVTAARYGDQYSISYHAFISE